MKVKFVRVHPQFEGQVNAVTIGKIYDVELLTVHKSAHIYDDEGVYSTLLYGEYEVVDEESDE